MTAQTRTADAILADLHTRRRLAALPPDTAAIPAGAEVLDQARAFIARFCALPSAEAFDAVALWAAHAHVIDSFESTPRIAFLSPEPGSGKTRALEVLELLVPHAMLAVNATPAALFRAVADHAHRPTVLFDEIDTVFGPKAKDNEELRGLLNAGHRRSGVAYRCVGEGTKQSVVAFPAYAAVALAGLGNLPDTILTRSIIIRMRRRAPHERVEPFRARVHSPEGHQLGEALATWTAFVADQLTHAWPTMPDGITDRPADVWEPLLALADAAGHDWPDRARLACTRLVADGVDRGISLGIRLLADLRRVFEGRAALGTEEILEVLHDLDDAPWNDLRGQALDPRGLARFLSSYEIRVTKVRGADGRSVRGYRHEDLADAWIRYLPAVPAAEAEQAELPEPPSSGPYPRFRSPPAVPHRPEPSNRSGTPDTPPTCAVPHVPQVPLLPPGRSTRPKEHPSNDPPQPPIASDRYADPRDAHSRGGRGRSGHGPHGDLRAGPPRPP
jgi:hypothetical protein